MRLLTFPGKNRLVAGSPLLGMTSLGEDVCELLRGVDSNQAQVSLLDRFMGEVLPNVNVLGTLSASDDVVTPLNASVVVLIDRGPGFWSKSHAPQDMSAGGIGDKSPQQPPWMLSSTPPLLLTEQSFSAASIAKKSASDCRGTSYPS